MSNDNSQPIHVRVARPAEHDALTRVLTRAFAKDPAMNWYGCVAEMVNDVDSPTPAARRTMRKLSLFQAALVKATILVNGVVTVAVAPRSNSTGKEKEGKEEEAEAEEVVGVALWLPPGKTLDMGPVTVIRSGLLNVLRGWGPKGVKRILLDFSPAVEHTLEKAFKSRNLDRLDSWHLLEVVVDPSHQGKGISTLLIKEGFNRASPKPIHLEATKESTRDIYAHYGFEVDAEHEFGVGEVDKFGVKARGEAATGIKEWVMTKWST